MKKETVVEIDEAEGTISVARLVQLANSYESTIYISKEGMKVNAKSIMGMMNLILTSGTMVTLEVMGPDEEIAINGIESFLLEQKTS